MLAKAYTSSTLSTVFSSSEVFSNFHVLVFADFGRERGVLIRVVFSVGG